MMKRGSRVGGRFEIVAAAGSGGMGTVFRARDISSRCDVAIKIVTPGGPDDAIRFRREAGILSRFRHPNVVGYVAHGPGFLAMEWVEGETLAHRLEAAPLSTRETLVLAHQLAGALAALHDAGILHRDVKPANLMLTQDRLKLVDFGIARCGRGPNVTITGAHLGTAGYMAPEQARGDRELTGRTDVFALGCVLYECLAGVPAFRGDSELALRAKALLHDPTPLRRIVPSISVALDELVLRLLARAPALRPTARELAHELATIEGDAPPPPARRSEAVMTAAGPGPRQGSTIAGDGSPRGAELPAAPACAIMVSIGDELPPLAQLTVWPFLGGAVATSVDAASAAELACAIACQLPAAVIAIACGATPGDAIDRGAQMVEHLELAAATGAQVAGVWIHVSVARALGARGSDAHGGLVRLGERP